MSSSSTIFSVLISLEKCILWSEFLYLSHSFYSLGAECFAFTFFTLLFRGAAYFFPSFFANDLYLLSKVLEYHMWPGQLHVSLLTGVPWVLCCKVTETIHRTLTFFCFFLVTLVCLCVLLCHLVCSTIQLVKDYEIVVWHWKWPLLR